VVLALVRKRQHEAKAGTVARIAEYGHAGLHVSRRRLRGDVVSGHHDGVPFRHHFIPADEDELGRAVVSVPTSASGEFHVRPETGGTEVVKQLGMVDEFQTGDLSFDRKYYFSGTSDEYVRAVFGVKESLEQLRALFAGGVNQLEKRGTALIASRPSTGLLEIAELQSIVEQLGKLKLPPMAPGAEKKGLSGKQALHVLRAALLALVLTGVAGFYTVNPCSMDGWTLPSGCCRFWS